MAFTLQLTESASQTFQQLEDEAKKRYNTRKQQGVKKSSPQEGLFKQVKKSIDLLTTVSYQINHKKIYN